MSHEAVRQMHKEHDQAIDVLRANTDKFNFHPPCKEGCFHCCYEAVFCDNYEAAYIVDGLTVTEQIALRVRVASWLEAARALLPLQMEDGIGIKWREANIPCPLLVMGRCSVYERRPAGCRAFYAMREPEKCAMPDRIHQKFAYLDRNPMICRSLMKYFSSFQRFRTDHLGVHLALLLLDEPDLESGASMGYECEEEPVSQ